MPATSISGTFGVAGANIANSVLGGIKIPSTGTGTSGGASSPAVPNSQFPAGPYVQDALAPTGDGNYIGVNTQRAWKTNVLQEDITNVGRVASFLGYIDDDAARGGTATYGIAGGTIAYDGRCDVVAATGVVSSNATGALICKVIGGVVINDYAWFPIFA